MGEKRKPCYIFLLKKEGKKKFFKVELFKATLWPRKEWRNGKNWEWKYSSWELNSRYRIRINGKWNKYEGHDVVFTKYEFRDILWRSISKDF